MNAYILVPSSLYNVACRTWPPKPCNSKNHAWHWIWLGSRIPSPKTCCVDLFFLVSIAAFEKNSHSESILYLKGRKVGPNLHDFHQFKDKSAVQFSSRGFVTFYWMTGKKVIDMLWVQSSKFYIWSKCLEQKVNFSIGM